MNKITGFNSPEDSTFVSWLHSETVIKLDFTFKIFAILLKSEERVLIVELKKEKDNATIYNADGSVFKRISNPDAKALCFGDVFYRNNELTLISRRRDGFMLAVTIDENGESIRVHESR